MAARRFIKDEMEYRLPAAKRPCDRQLRWTFSKTTCCRMIANRGRHAQGAYHDDSRLAEPNQESREHMESRRIAIAVGSIVLASLTVSGCGKKDEQEAKKPATQVVAKVDSEEISVHQLNAVLSKTSGLSQENLGLAKWEILGKLIEQQLAVTKAVERKLDRKPEVMMAIDGAKREILARAYLQELAAAQVKPTADEVRTYYDEHPELFAQRRIYRLQEITLPKKDELLPALQEKVASSKSMEQIAVWLKEQNIPFKPGGGVRAAEQLPLEMLPKVHALKDGQIALIPTNEGMIIIRVTGSETQPVDQAQAAPRIQTFLTNQRSTEAIQREMKVLKEKAKIEYLGEFAGGVPPKPVAPPKLAEQPLPPKRVAPPPPPPPKPAGSPVGDQKLIEKGVSGLK
jgi:EpsD family peptidyl-prolyl cis-trans isomerase